jgi:hypothetical protein
VRQFFRTLAMSAALAISGCAATGGHFDGAIATRADVRVDDGRTYVIESYYAAIDDAAVRQTRPNGEINISAINGDHAWTSGSDQDGGDMLRTVVLGHQFHALLLHFDGILSNVREQEVVYNGRTHRARDGAWPFGEGAARLLIADERPVGMVFNFAGVPEITVMLDDWRVANGTSLPHHLTIDDGTRSFDYSYTEIAPAAQRPAWARQD